MTAIVRAVTLVLVVLMIAIGAVANVVGYDVDSFAFAIATGVFLLWLTDRRES